MLFCPAPRQYFPVPVYRSAAVQGSGGVQCRCWDHARCTALRYIGVSANVISVGVSVGVVVSMECSVYNGVSAVFITDLLQLWLRCVSALGVITSRLRRLRGVLPLPVPALLLLLLQPGRVAPELPGCTAPRGQVTLLCTFMMFSFFMKGGTRQTSTGVDRGETGTLTRLVHNPLLSSVLMRFCRFRNRITACCERSPTQNF